VKETKERKLKKYDRKSHKGKHKKANGRGEEKKPRKEKEDRNRE
jgi:hypothetical protein